MGRGLDGGEQRLAGILAGHAQELSQRQRRLQLAPALEGDEVGGDLRQAADQLLLLGERRALVPPALASGRAMLGPEHVVGAGLDRAGMRRDLARPVGNDDAVLGLAHLEAAADERGGHGVVVGVEGDVALDIDQALVDQIRLGDPAGQPPQGRVLDGEQLARRGLELPLGAGIDAVAPGAGLAIGVGPVGEASAGQEAALDEAEHPLDTAGAIGVADGVGDKGEAETLGERGHLGHGDHVAPGAAQHDDVGIVDQAALGDPIEVAEGLGEEDLALEAAEARVELEEQQARVGEHEAGGLHAPPRAAEMQVVR